MLVQTHDDTLRHRRGEQFLCFLQRIGVPQVDEDHVPARQQFRVRSEHGGAATGDAAAGFDQRVESGAQRRLGANPNRRSAPRGARRANNSSKRVRRAQEVVANHDQVEVQGIVLPLGDPTSNPGRPPRGSGDGNPETLRCKNNSANHSAHLAAAADHQCTFAAAVRLGPATRACSCRRQRRLYQLPATAIRPGPATRPAENAVSTAPQ